MSINYSNPDFEQIQNQLATLQATVKQQQSEIEQLRANEAQTLDTPAQAMTRPASRRRMLKGLAVAALGTAAGTAFLAGGEKAQAAGGATPNIGWYAFPGSTGTAVNLPAKAGLAGSTEPDFSGAGVQAGVYGYAKIDNGVWGNSDSGNGVVGVSKTRTGVNGVSTSGFGVRGDSISNNGVNGSSVSGTGVFGFSSTGNGVVALSPNFTALSASTSGGPVTVGVLATSTEGKAVYGRSSQNYGGVFSGGKAQLRLEPSSTVDGAPTTGLHEVGEFFVDKNGNLFYCTFSGTPGSWKLLAEGGLPHK